MDCQAATAAKGSHDVHLAWLLPPCAGRGRGRGMFAGLGQMMLQQELSFILLYHTLWLVTINVWLLYAVEQIDLTFCLLRLPVET